MKGLRTRKTREWLLRSSAGQELTLRLEPGETATVGRDLTSDLPILDAGVSRHHASFSFEEDDLWLEDLHSQNGTFVNTERVWRTNVHSGDVITFGRATLTLTARSPQADEPDPLERLTQESLARLLHLSRQFGAEKGRTDVFQRLMEMATSALGADRGVVFLWEEGRGHFHPVAAVPQEVFRGAVSLVTSSLAQSVVRGAKARLLPGPSSGCAGSAVASPVFAGRKVIGLLYLDRAPGRGCFQAADVDFLFALTWVASEALEAFVLAAGAAEHPAKAPEGAVRWPATAPPPRARSEGKPDADAVRVLEEIEGLLARRGALVASHAGEEGAHRLAADALVAARLCIESARRLLEKRPHQLEEVRLGRAFAEVAGLDRGRRSYEVDGGQDIVVFCDPRELLLAMRLSAEAVADGGSGPIRISAVSAEEEPAARVRLERAGWEVPEGRADARELLLGLAERLAADRVHGCIDASGEGGSVELQVPLPAVSLGTTIVLPKKS